MFKILIIGGEGYLGVETKKFFLKKKYFTVSVDNLQYKQKKPAPQKNFKFYNLSILEKKKIIQLVKKYQFDLVIILAGLVGDPITKRYPKQSKKINDIGIKNLIKIFFKETNSQVIFVSTCSNYGITNKIAYEKSRLNPISAYAKDKVSAERLIMSSKYKKKKWIILRLATLFGPSERMRFDLTINEFTRDLFFKKKIVVYDKKTIRPYCYVGDVPKLFYKILKKKNEHKNNVYNVGRNDQNFSKEDIIQNLMKFFPKARVEFINKKGSDKRNYRVNFDKLNKEMHFRPKVLIRQGIKKIIRSIIRNRASYLNKKKFGNFEI